MTHPITPPPELVGQWFREAQRDDDPDVVCWMQATAERAAQWGADQELEACCELMDDWGLEASDLRAARRPKPPSLKEQALMALEDGDTAPGASLTSNEVDTIRRALEVLPDD
jgi:hypothetical protein